MAVLLPSPPLCACQPPGHKVLRSRHLSGPRKAAEQVTKGRAGGLVCMLLVAGPWHLDGHGGAKSPLGCGVRGKWEENLILQSSS